jgi:GAF domain-containing protein
VVVARDLGIDARESDALRVTFHRVVKPGSNPSKIEQLTPYVGGQGGNAGRQFPIQAGVAGRAVTTRKPKILQFSASSSIDERVDELTEWGYTRDSAQAVVGKNRLSFMGVPLFGRSGHVIGVVYLDSVKENQFAEENLDIVMNTCSGLALYLEQYS